MPGRKSRTKGHNFERAVARKLKEIWPEARRGIQYRDGAEAPDVDIPEFWVECKKGKTTNPKAAIAQAVEASVGGGKTPIAITKDDRQPALVTMRLDDWMQVIGEWWQEKRGRA